MKNLNGSVLLKKILSRNQNNYRLTDLKPLNELNEDARIDIEGYLSSRGSRPHHGVGVLLYGLISHGSPVVVISCNDLDALICKVRDLIPEGEFKIRSMRGKLSIWAQLTGILVNNEVITILKKQIGSAPAVIEVKDSGWLSYIGKPVTDELRLEVINSTSKVQFATLADALVFNT